MSISHVCESPAKVDYSVVYFDHIAVFKALYYRTSFNSEVHVCCVDASGINASPLQSKMQCERLYRDDTCTHTATLHTCS